MASMPFNKVKGLGRGAYGTVDQIERKSDPTQVYARKTFTLKRRQTNRAGTEEAIMHEANVIRSLKHDHIVNLVETYKCDM